MKATHYISPQGVRPSCFVPSTASGHVTQAQPSRLPRNVGLEQAGEWPEVAHLRAAAPGQTLPVAAQTRPAAGPPRPDLHAASSCQPPANSAGPPQPSSKLPSAPGAPSLISVVCNGPDTVMITLGSVTLLLKCNDS